MPTNLTAEAKKALANYQLAKTLDEKIIALEKALSLIPKHKGTEKLCAQIKKRIKELREEKEEKSKKIGRRKKDIFSIKKEGEAQVVLIGTANSGKSSILSALTNAKPEIASYPLTTKKPELGMLHLNEVNIQLVELPSIIFPDGKETQFATRSINLAKNSDVIIVVIDGTYDAITQLNQIFKLFYENGIILGSPKIFVDIKKTPSGGIRIITFGNFKGSLQEVQELLLSIGIKNAIIKIYGDATINDVEEAILRENIYKKGLIIINKFNPAFIENKEEYTKAIQSYDLPYIEISNIEIEKEKLKEAIWNLLDLIRVYTRKDGVVSEKPLIVPKGITVGEVAKIIHKDFVKKLKYARIWGKSVKINGQRVSKEHYLEDQDIIELYT
ncbi:MAG: TGS domain-containing protein [Nitrososphaerota archaeon]